MENKDEKKDLVKENTPDIEIPKATEESQADFSKIFNVASEEKVEIPKPKVQGPQVIGEQPTEEISKPKVEKKPSQFNGEEKILYEIKPEKESSPVVPAIFFAILIATIFLLPYVSQKIDFTFIPNTGNQQVVAEETEDFYYFNKSSVRAKIGDLEFTNFVKSNINGEYRVSFTITNTALRTYRFDKKYYVVLYDEKENVLFHSLIYSYEAIGAMGAQSITLNVTENAFKKSDRFKIEEIPTSTYPEVTLIEKEGEYEVMKCTYVNNTIKYYFINDKLVKIHDEYKESKDSNSNYNANKNKYKELSERYKKVPNFSSVFIETDVDFQMINEIELSKITEAQLTEISTYRFFKYNESKDIISFELESQAYTCS